MLTCFFCLLKNVFISIKQNNFNWHTSVCIILFISTVLLIDYSYVKINNEIPNFYLKTESKNDVTHYDCLFYDVYTINTGLKNKYKIVDTKNKYTIDTIPKSIFNRNISGIDNIIKYKNKYVEDNSKDDAIINLPPLSEYGYTFEIDSNTLGLIINYNITGWYIEDNNYFKASLIYNSVSISNLIENVEYIKYEFNEKIYEITRKNIEEKYPNYKELNNNSLDNFNEYVESKISNYNFSNQTFDLLFNQ